MRKYVFIVSLGFFLHWVVSFFIGAPTPLADTFIYTIGVITGIAIVHISRTVTD